MYQEIAFAILSAMSLGLWTIFHQKASAHINSLFGVIIVSFIAVIFGILLFIPKIKTVVFIYKSQRNYFFNSGWIVRFGN